MIHKLQINEEIMIQSPKSWLVRSWGNFITARTYLSCLALPSYVLHTIISGSVHYILPYGVAQGYTLHNTAK